MRIESYTETNVGKRRNNNEDNYFVNGSYKNDTNKLNDAVVNNSDGTYNLFAVCDGMGGEEYGEKASLIAVSQMNSYYGTDFNETVSEYVESTNKQICDLILENNGLRSGTTLAALYINNENATVYNVGDSRVYLLRNKKLMQLSVDHTRIQQMLNMGIVSPEAAKTHKDKHVLTQHFGVFPDELIISEHKTESIKIENGDIFLLCSDGLTDMLEDNEIESILNQRKTAKELGNELVRAALSMGGRDNVTVQVVKCTSKKSIKIPVICVCALVVLTLCATVLAQMNIAGRFEDFADLIQNRANSVQDLYTENSENIEFAFEGSAKYGETISADILIKNLKDITKVSIYVGDNTEPVSVDVEAMESDAEKIEINDISIVIPEKEEGITGELPVRIEAVEKNDYCEVIHSYTVNIVLE